ncbi:MAG TPA: DUF3592 domain-containing protein [Opitutaceae bacterium]|jgi:hypothetical protein
MTTGGKAAVAVIWIALVAAGITGLILLRNEQRRAATEAAAANWMPLSAKMLSASVQTIPHPRPLGPKFSRRINYAYAVDGAEYTSTRYSFDGDQTFRTREAAEGATPGAGQVLPIFFDPAQPAQAVVQIHGHAPLDAWKFRYGLPLLAVGDGLLLLVAARYLRMRARAMRVRPLTAK